MPDAGGHCKDCEPGGQTARRPVSQGLRVRHPRPVRDCGPDGQTARRPVSQGLRVRHPRPVRDCGPDGQTARRPVSQGLPTRPGRPHDDRILPLAAASSPADVSRLLISMQSRITQCSAGREFANGPARVKPLPRAQPY